MKSSAFLIASGLSCVLSLAIAPAARADDALVNEVAAIKKANEPIEPGDFEIHGVADADNPAIALRQAADSINTKTPAWMAYDYLNDIAAPISDSEAATFGDLVKENAKAFELVDLAMTRKSVDWQIKMISPVPTVLLPHLSTQRTLARLLQARALLKHREKADADAVSDIHGIIFVGQAIDQQGFVVGHLVSIGIEAIASKTAETIAPDLQIGPAPAASLAQVKQLIAELLDDGPSRQGERNALLMERMSDLDVVRGIASGKLTPEDQAKLISPKLKSQPIAPESAATEGVVMLTYVTDALHAFDATSDYQTLIARNTQRPKDIAADPNAHALANMLEPSFGQIFLNHYRGLATNHLSAVALAIRAYAVAHDGKRPAQLTDLVPEYFPSIPADPFAANAHVKYDAAKAIVYSVGEDGKDDGGSEKPSGRKGPRPGRWQQQDVVVHLDRQPRK